MTSRYTSTGQGVAQDSNQHVGSGGSNGGRSRRRFLQSAVVGVAGMAGLAGCLGGSGGDSNGGGDGGGNSDGETPLRMMTATEGTTAYAGNQGIAAVVNENTDEVFVEAQTSPGTEANVGALANEEAEMVYLQNWSAQKIVNEEPPYDDLGFDMTQVFHFYDLPWFFVAKGDDLKTVGDIDGETTVSPTPEGSGTAPALETAIEYAVDGYDRISITYGQQASALDEGRLDVGVGTYLNFDLVPGWLDEMMSTVDLRILDVPDAVLSEWEADDRLLVQQFDGSELESATTPDVVNPITFSHNFVSRADLEYDAVYEFLTTMFENRESLSEYHAVLETLSEGDFWVQNAYSGMPFHDAAADFYQEQGLWRDEFERASEQ